MPQPSFENEREYPIDDSIHYTAVGILLCFLCALAGWTILLGIALFGGVILATLQHVPPSMILTTQNLPIPLTFLAISFFLVGSLIKAGEWGEYLIADQLREKRKMKALAHRTR